MKTRDFSGVLFIAGQIGAGKSVLAQRLHAYFNCPVVHADEIKHRVYKTYSDFARSAWVPDEYRQRAYEQIATRMAELVQRDDVMIVDENMYRANMREILYSEARQTRFGCKVILVVSSDEDTVSRLQNKREGHTLANPVQTYLDLRNNFDPMPEADLVIYNDSTVEAMFAQALEFLEQ